LKAKHTGETQVQYSRPSSHLWLERAIAAWSIRRKHVAPVCNVLRLRGAPSGQLHRDWCCVEVPA
jgi:hypothetical protein